MKLCSRCNIEKENSEFHKRKVSVDGLQPHCIECERLAHRNHYVKNKSVYVIRSMNRRKRLVQQYKEWKSQQQCAICGEKEEICLDLHHEDPDAKEYSMSRLSQENFGNEKWKAEIAKCTILCANCHRKVHKYGLKKVQRRGG